MDTLQLTGNVNVKFLKIAIIVTFDVILLWYSNSDLLLRFVVQSLSIGGTGGCTRWLKYTFRTGRTSVYRLLETNRSKAEFQMTDKAPVLG